ncbi:MAG: ABC transporter substrate-binding protein [Flavobacteriales bacterium]
MQKVLFFLYCFVLFISCNESKNNATEIQEQAATVSNKIKYAKGFTIQYFKNYKVITVKNAWQGSEKVFNYLLLNKGTLEPETNQFDAIIPIPVEKIVVTSTTHIPSLEMLGMDSTLIGFPNLDYISSKKTRKHISEGQIKELGKNQNLNTEVTINLNPDVVVGFGVDGNNKSLNTLQKAGIPIVFNGDWTETSPLGKAEWIKFFAAFYNKEKEANTIFSKIETNYTEAKNIAKKAKLQPTVLSGAMYKDVWYLPQGNSWAAQFIEDANANYLWKDSKGTGSLQLSIESVLEKGQNAAFWIGPGYATNLEQLKKEHLTYSKFAAYNDKKVYGFTNKKGETGGVLYFELGPNRPDLILKDLIKILHPSLLPNYKLFFFNKFD